MVWEWTLLVFSEVPAGDFRAVGMLCGLWQVWFEPNVGEGGLINLAVTLSELPDDLPLAVGLEVGVSPWFILFWGQEKKVNQVRQMGL